MIEKNPEAPHKAILYIEATVHEVRPDGHCSGSITQKVEKFPLAISGINLSETIRKLNTIISEIKEKCQSNRM